ncbi:unnamed protein product [Symbiodinium sp. CCMP2592]|nr:unnamed protein product [Symbiodinium sp. CCMP2592]
MERASALMCLGLLVVLPVVLFVSAGVEEPPSWGDLQRPSSSYTGEWADEMAWLYMDLSYGDIFIGDFFLGLLFGVSSFILVQFVDVVFFISDAFLFFFAYDVYTTGIGDLCAGLQDEEAVAAALTEDLDTENFSTGLSPIPEDLPLPYLKPTPMVETTSEKELNWYAALHDTRELRGIRRLETKHRVTSMSTDLDGRNTPSTLGSGTTATSSSSTSSMVGGGNVLDNDGGRAPSSSSSSTYNGQLGSETPSSDPWQPCEWPLEPGVHQDGGLTTRGGRTRMGRDRWHHEDGSVRYRLRERLAADVTGDDDHVGSSLSSSDSSSILVPQVAPFTIQGHTMSNTGNWSLQATTFYGETFSVHSDKPPGGEASTTAGSSSVEDSEHSSTSTSEDNQIGVGFWRHGVWINRPRTPQELRQHVGGAGAKRLARRQNRVSTYLRGEWIPAWLRDYKQQKADRDLLKAEGACQTPSVPDLSVTTPGNHEVVQVTEEPSPNTLNDDGTQQCSSAFSSNPEHGSQQWWWQWNATGSWTWTSSWDWSQQWGDSSWIWSSSSSTTSSTFVVIPNAGLFPDVTPAPPPPVPPGDWMMSITNSEEATLLEAGIPRGQVDRVAALLASLDRHQAQGSGPESRWAIACLVRRIDEGQEALDRVRDVLARRLVPRGFLPVRRIPAQEFERWRFFNWARGHTDLLQQIFQHHLDVRLQPRESGPSPQFLPESPQSLVHSAELDGSTEEAGPTRASSPSASAHSGAPLESSDESGPVQPSMDSEWAYNSQGELVYVPPASVGGSPRGPPPPLPVNMPPRAVQGDVASSSSSNESAHPSLPPAPTELLGIWREPETTTSTSTSSIVSSTTMTSTMQLDDQGVNFSVDLPYALWCPSLWVVQDDWLLGEGCMDCFGTTTTTTTWTDKWRPMLTSTSTTSSLPWPSDIVRDEVSRQAIHGGQADIIDLIRRLLDRQRRLRHVDRLLSDAIEEALQWVHLPLVAVPLNSGTMEGHIWRTVSQQASFGSAPSETTPSQVASSPAILLQPGFPRTVEEIVYALGDDYSEPSRFAHLRRRAWRVHVHNIIQAADGVLPGRDQGPDPDLYLVQLNEDIPIPNWPVDDDAHRPEIPWHRLSVDGLRRRGRARRPPPRFLGPDRALSVDSEEVHGRVTDVPRHAAAHPPSVDSAVVREEEFYEPLHAADDSDDSGTHGRRERSRSRDGDE